MDVYLQLPGHDAATRRKGYRGWLEVFDLHFERPLLEKEAASFTVHRVQDALTHVLHTLAATGRTLSCVRVHSVEGSEPLMRLCFEGVRVAACGLDSTAYESTELVRFEAASWRFE